MQHTSDQIFSNIVNNSDTTFDDNNNGYSCENEQENKILSINDSDIESRNQPKINYPGNYLKAHVYASS